MELSYLGSTSCVGVAGVLLITGVLHTRELSYFGSTSCVGVAGVPDLQDMKKLTQMIDANLIKSLVLGEGLLPTPH